MNRTDNILDSWLVLSYRTGNKKAMALLVKKWHSKFCKQAYWYTKDVDLAKDIAQDSWTTIIRKINALEDTNKFGSWSLAIVNRKCIDWTRKQKRRYERLKEYYDGNHQTEIEKDSNDHIQKLKHAIGQLPEEQQMVIRLFYTESYNQNEISEILNISKGTVKSRLFYAREKLKTIIKYRNYE